MRILARLLKTLYTVEDIFLVTAVFVATATVCVHVFFRYVLQNPLLGTEEIVRYLQIAITFIGLAVVSRRGEHINVSVFERIVRSTRSIQIKDIFLEFLALTFTAIFAYFSYYYLMLGFSSGESSALSIPLVLPYSTLFVGFVITTLHHTVRLINSIIKFNASVLEKQKS
jgi:TRAP-type C4-dicarboxylate transport system permease small subunit